MIELYKNSYVTVEDADNYFSQKLDADFWEELDTVQKEKALITASRQIDLLPFLGVKFELNQPMSFPRIIQGKIYDMLDKVKEAVCEQAVYLLSENYKQNSNIKSVTLGSASLSFKDNADFSISDEARKLLSGLLKTGFDIEKSFFREVY